MRLLRGAIAAFATLAMTGCAGAPVRPPDEPVFPVIPPATGPWLPGIPPVNAGLGSSHSGDGSWAAMPAPPRPVELPPKLDVIATNESGELEKNDLEDFDMVGIQLAYADVSVSSGAAGRHGRVRIQKAKGGRDCVAYLRVAESSLVVTDVTGGPTPGVAEPAWPAAGKTKDGIPAPTPCRFSVELALHESADLTVDLRRGSFFAENWRDPIKATVEWGDIDAGSVGPLDVRCRRCMLAGEGVAGPLRYWLDAGNVGMAGLSGPVDGQTLGDTILKWRSVPAATEIRLVSHAGDVFLFFPPKAALATDLKALHGEVETRFRASSGGGAGARVSVTAEMGNVRLYRTGK